MAGHAAGSGIRNRSLDDLFQTFDAIHWAAMTPRRKARGRSRSKIPGPMSMTR